MGEGYDRRLPRAPRTEPSLAELAVLGLLCEAPAHGWSLARELAPTGSVGRVWSCTRPLVYRALEQLTAHGLARAGSVVAGGPGPQRRPFSPTAAGRRVFDAWCTTPVAHVRDVRTDLMLKLLLLDRSGRDPAPLLHEQRAVLAGAERALERDAGAADGFERTLALARLANARAALSLVDALLDRHPGEPVVYRSIGTIRSSHRDLGGMPLHPVADRDGTTTIEVDEAHRGCLVDLDGFSHVWVLAHLHEIVGWSPTVPAFLDDEPRGTFATRSPRRPNPIGLSLTPILEVRPDAVVVGGLDLLDGTPVLDLKPYVELFDRPPGPITSGWFEGRVERVFERTSDERFGRRTSART